MINQKIAEILQEITELLEIKGAPFFKINAYQNASRSLEGLKEDVALIYKREGIQGLKRIPAIGAGMSEKIEQYLKKNKISYYDELKEDTAIRQIITHYFKSKGLGLHEIKRDAKKRKIIYSRFTRPAKQLLELAGSVNEAKRAIDKVAAWAKSRDLDYAIETVFKKWLELDRLKPKKPKKRAFYDGKPMYFSETKRKWYVIDDDGTWLEFAGKKSDVEWRTIK